MPVGEVVEEFAKTTSLHAVPHIVSAKKWTLKLVWTAIFTAALVMVVKDVVSLYNKYSEGPKLIQSEMRFSDLPFPAVTICNLNPIMKSQAEQIPQLQGLLDACNAPVLNGSLTPPASAEYCESKKNSYQLMFPK